MNTLSRSMAVAGAFFISTIGFDASAATKTLKYDILRDGSSIGTHAVSIDTNGPETKVDVTTDIKVKVLFVTAYKFTHESKEKWVNGKLVSLASKTDDDGVPKTLNATAENGKITLDSTMNGQNRRQFAAKSAIPASLWNPEIVTQEMIVNTLDGQLMKVNIKDIGTEDVQAHGSTVAAHHYKISGELTRDLWYNSQGDLVRVSFPDKTKSEIVYALN